MLVLLVSSFGALACATRPALISQCSEPSTVIATLQRIDVGGNWERLTRDETQRLWSIPGVAEDDSIVFEDVSTDGRCGCLQSATFHRGLVRQIRFVREEHSFEAASKLAHDLAMAIRPSDPLVESVPAEGEALLYRWTLSPSLAGSRQLGLDIHITNEGVLWCMSATVSLIQGTKSKEQDRKEGGGP